MLSDYTSKNNLALDFLKKENIQIKKFPDSVIKKLMEISKDVMAEVGGHDDFTKKIYKSYYTFLKKVRPWTKISELAYLNTST